MWIRFWSNSNFRTLHRTHRAPHRNNSIHSYVFMPKNNQRSCCYAKGQWSERASEQAQGRMGIFKLSWNKLNCKINYKRQLCKCISVPLHHTRPSLTRAARVCVHVWKYVCVWEHACVQCALEPVCVGVSWWKVLAWNLHNYRHSMLPTACGRCTLLATWLLSATLSQ